MITASLLLPFSSKLPNATSAPASSPPSVLGPWEEEEAAAGAAASLPLYGLPGMNSGASTRCFVCGSTMASFLLRRSRGAGFLAGAGAETAAIIRQRRQRQQRE